MENLNNMTNEQIATLYAELSEETLQLKDCYELTGIAFGYNSPETIKVRFEYLESEKQFMAVSAIHNKTVLSAYFDNMTESEFAQFERIHNLD